MAGFNFEKNLEHQGQAVKSTTNVFKGVELIKQEGTEKNHINPVFHKDANNKYINNIKNIQQENDLESNAKKDSNIIDIMMETGTGKTYTYTKTIFELNKYYGIFKFVIVVPTLSIKAGTIDFLKSESSRSHFKEQYGKTIKLHVLESSKSSKQKKSYMPNAVTNFVKSGNYERNMIQVLLVNQGMINAKSTNKSSGDKVLTLEISYDTRLFDKYSVPFDAIAATNPFMIIDEPHKFDVGNKTWNNIQKMQAQHIIRYGATFPEFIVNQKNALGKNEKVKVKDYKNLVYTLTAVESFKKNLVKGVEGHITEFETGKNAIVKFTNSDGKEANFQIQEKDKKETYKLIKNESLEKLHPAMKDLLIEKLNKTSVVLSNGLELKKGQMFNPYSYAVSLQEQMIQKAVRLHFEKEKELLTRQIKIKPLSLFFIDNIKEFRNKDGYLKKTIEKYTKAEIEKLLETEEDPFYREHLQKSLQDIPSTHAGYFAEDKNETDEVIEREINEILHDKQALLNLDNKTRFIFSKWTLKEGWDNPNIFQICKLRSSGSDISRLQEVGRGLRLPVNEYGNRVKDEQFFLNYFVDFTENDFVKNLKDEINNKSGIISIEDVQQKLTEDMIKQIIAKYEIEEEDLLQKLDDENIIKRNNDFKENGFKYIKNNYPLIFDKNDKIRDSRDKQKQRLKVRKDKYTELKNLWEKLNEKVVLEYKIKNEAKFKQHFIDFLKQIDLTIKGARDRKETIYIENDEATAREEASIYNDEITPISTLRYDDFLKQLSSLLNINLKTIHESFNDIELNINNYLNQSTLSLLKEKFDYYLLYNALNKFEISYQQVKSSIHPTKLTNEKGQVSSDVESANIGTMNSDSDVANNYLFDKLFYDSDLERKNIENYIREVIVFSKIPKNSIRIPVAGGKSYSPDFAYVVNYKDGGNKINFIIETKDTDEESLRAEEKQKIKHAEKLYDDKINIKFKSQFKNQEIVDLIRSNGF